MLKNRLKIGLDFHGVISERPDYFAEFCGMALNKGYEIHIITGGPKDVVSRELAAWRVPYSHLFAIVDYYDSLGEVEHFPNGEFKVDEKLWDTAKAEYCNLNGINMHIDDSSRYVKWFSTPYCHYDVKLHKCLTENQFLLDFSLPAEQVLQKIADLISAFQYS